MGTGILVGNGIPGTSSNKVGDCSRLGQRANTPMCVADQEGGEFWGGTGSGPQRQQGEAGGVCRPGGSKTGGGGDTPERQHK